MVKFSNKIHKKKDLIKIFLGFIEHKLFFPKRKNKELIVLNYHGVPKQFLKNFEFQVNYLKEHFSIIKPKELGEFYKEINYKHDKPRLLITFDDGTQNILGAIEILEKNDIKSFLFVIPKFINSKNPDLYYSKYIRPKNIKNIETEKEDYGPIKWDILKKLIHKSHYVGSHSFSHTMDLNTEKKDLEKEIIGSKKIIEESLNIKINSFCSINNSLLSINKYAANLIKKHYCFHFTTISGNNYPLKPYSIKRINVEAYWTKYQFLYAIGKFDSLRWKSKKRKMDKLIQS